MAMRIKKIQESSTFSSRKSLEGNENSDDFEGWMSPSPQANENPHLPIGITGARTSLEDMLLAQETPRNRSQAGFKHKIKTIYDKNNPYELLAEPAPIERNTFQYVFDFIVIPPPQQDPLTNRKI